jgi:hypothetical protein
VSHKHFLFGPKAIVRFSSSGHFRCTTETAHSRYDIIHGALRPEVSATPKRPTHSITAPNLARVSCPSVSPFSDALMFVHLSDARLFLHLSDALMLVRVSMFSDAYFPSLRPPHRAQSLPDFISQVVV